MLTLPDITVAAVTSNVSKYHLGYPITINRSTANSYASANISHSGDLYTKGHIIRSTPL